MKKAIIAIASLGGLIVATAAGAQMIRGNYDEPAFESVHESKPFEIRRYGARVVAETTVEASSFREATSLGFERLAGYIFGGNKGAGGEPQKIAMTTPVESAPAGEDSFTIVFTMPPKWSLDELPKPNDPTVVIRLDDPKTVATARFSGNARNKDLSELSEKLMAYIAEQGYVARSEVTIAQYDPPWTPGLLRRNELIVEVGEVHH